MGKQDTIKEIQVKMEKLGDLPVFSASVNHICNLSSDPDADAMQLSQEVLKDANLSVKLLRLANSPYYNRGLGKISVISRAIIMLGFNTVKNLSLTMKLIESFQHEHPGIDMDKLLVRAYIAAGFVRDMAIKCGVKDVEETYTCALLHDLGEIVVAYFLPEKFIEIENLNKERLLPPNQNETAVLGSSLSTVGKELATAWDFSSKVVSTMDQEMPKITGQITKPVELNKVLSGLASKVVASLYGDGDSDENFQSLLNDLAKATGIKVSDVQGSLTNSFRMSCELAKEYGLPSKKLMPKVIETDDETRDNLARQFSFFASNQIPSQQTSSSSSADNSSAAPQADASSSSSNAIDSGTPPEQNAEQINKQDDSGFNPELQLQYIQEVTSLITDGAKLNTVLIKVLEGIHTGVGFARVVLCLLSVDKTSYAGRIAIGTDKELVKEFFTRKLDINGDIFSRVLKEGVDIYIEDSHDKRWAEVLPPKYHNTICSNSCVAATLRSGMKPLGFIYADKAHATTTISPEQHRGFIQFVAQGRLALQTCR